MTGSAVGRVGIFVHAFDQPIWAQIMDRLDEAGWDRRGANGLADIVADKKRWVYWSGEIRTELQVWAQGDGDMVGMKLFQHAGPTSHVLLTSEWISVARLAALLDTMGIVRVEDVWLEQWRRSLWS